MHRTWSSPWRYVAVVLLCAGILVARTPNLFGPHGLAFEDGAVFFADAFNYPPWAPILLPYAGYWHLAPRLIAEVGSYLPLGVVPAFYAFCALVLSSVAISWFALPNFRAVVRHDDLRLAFVLLVALLPGLNTPLWIAYAQWLIALWGTLLVLMTPPRNRWLQWALAVAYLAAVATAPALFVLLPLWIVRIVRAPERSQRLWMGMIVAATLLLAAATLLVQASEPGVSADGSLLITDVTRSMAFRLLVSPFTGFVLANEIVRTLDWPALYGLAAALAVLLALAVAAAARSASTSKRLAFGAVAYIAASTAALYVRRAQQYGYLYATGDGAPLHSLRYHFLGMCAVLLLCLMVLDHFVTTGRIRRSTIWVGVLIVLLLYSPNFSNAHWQNDQSWPPIAHLLRQRIDPVADAGWSPAYPQPAGGEAETEAPVALPAIIRILPPTWTMRLLFPPGTPQGYKFPEGPRLLGIDSQVVDGQVQFDLFWQTAGGEGYTAFVHLLDQAGSRIGGADVMLEPPQEPLVLPPAQSHLPDLVWSTRHVFALPAEIEAGRYDVAVGLYSLQQGQLAPGSAVILRDQVEIGAHG